jgi:putative flippase GtrA
VQKKISIASSDINQLFRFILVGILNTGFGYGVFVITYLLTRTPPLAIALSTVLGVIFNFFTTGRVVFENSKLSRLIPFALVYAVLCILNIAIFPILEKIGLGALVTQLICLPPMVLMAFVLNKKFVFARGR